MRFFRWSVLIAFALLCGKQSSAKPKKPAVPAVFGTATYVYVEAMDGDEMSARVDPDDRQAIADVRDALERWGRYKLVFDRSHADLVLVVRRGRQVGGRAGTGGTPFPGPPRVQPGGVSLGGSTDANAGPPTDQLRVYTTTPDGKESSLVWMEDAEDGLAFPALPLVRRLKAAVDETYPPQAPADKAQEKKP